MDAGQRAVAGVESDGDASGRRVLRRTRAGLTAGMVVANVVGALVVFVLAVFIVPEPYLPDRSSIARLNLVMLAVYVALAVVAGTVFGWKRLASLDLWLPTGRTPTADQQLAVLRGPQRLAVAMGGLWAIAVVLFGTVNATRSVDLGIRVTFVVAFGGMATCTVAYLLAERLLREAAARVLTTTEPPERVVQSVVARQLLTWVLATGAPVLGIVAIGIGSLAGAPDMGRNLGRTMVALGGTALAVGLLATVIAARATADPITSLRRAVDEVRSGDLDVEVPVYDGTDIGLLQAGFNRMAVGLREREELRDLFGRHVGVEVARQAVEHGIELGGEVRDVAVLFVDLVGSTTLATELPPPQVVEVLNRFFAVVVDAVESCGGYVNKFAGDAVLAVFGAPAPVPDRNGSALAAARLIACNLRVELADRDFGIGVAAGPTVAGNIGTARRLEYTVIGDPVNEASRLTDLAKTLPGRLVASGDVVDGSGAAGWVHHSDVVVRGRSATTRVYVESPNRPT